VHEWNGMRTRHPVLSQDAWSSKHALLQESPHEVMSACVYPTGAAWVAHGILLMRTAMQAGARITCDAVVLCLNWPSCTQVSALRTVSAGQGLMLEASSRRLMQPGMPHHKCPDKARTPAGCLALTL